MPARTPGRRPGRTGADDPRLSETPRRGRRRRTQPAEPHGALHHGPAAHHAGPEDGRRRRRASIATAGGSRASTPRPETAPPGRHRAVGRPQGRHRAPVRRSTPRRPCGRRPPRPAPTRRRRPRAPSAVAEPTPRSAAIGAAVGRPSDVDPRRQGVTVRVDGHGRARSRPGRRARACRAPGRAPRARVVPTAPRDHSSVPRGVGAHRDGAPVAADGQVGRHVAGGPERQLQLGAEVGVRRPAHGERRAAAGRQVALPPDDRVPVRADGHARQAHLGAERRARQPPRPAPRSVGAPLGELHLADVARVARRGAGAPVPGGDGALPRRWWRARAGPPSGARSTAWRCGSIAWRPRRARGCARRRRPGGAARRGSTRCGCAPPGARPPRRRRRASTATAGSMAGRPRREMATGSPQAPPAGRTLTTIAASRRDAAHPRRGHVAARIGRDDRASARAAGPREACSGPVQAPRAGAAAIGTSAAAATSEADRRHVQTVQRSGCNLLPDGPDRGRRGCE